MPQTRFVLKKALDLGLVPIIVVNKVDRPMARPEEVFNDVLELLLDLGASDEQLDSPVVYASARDGWASLDPNTKGTDLTPLFDTILKTILIIGVTALGAALAYALHTDYGAIGVLAICAAYGFRNQKKELQMAVPCIVLSVLNMSELCALADAGIVHFYNGKRGLKLKWVFYIFYPLHLLILAGICVLLFK